RPPPGRAVRPVKLALREALLSFRRTPILSALSITTIAFALFVIGLVGLVALNFRHALAQIEERVEIVAYMMRGTPVEVVTVAIGDVQHFPEVAAVRYVTEDRSEERRVGKEGIGRRVASGSR